MIKIFVNHERSNVFEMILELKRDKERKSLAEEVLGEGVEVRAFTAKVTLKVKNLDEITEELPTALRQQCEVQVTTAVVSLRRGPAGSQAALVQLHVAVANKSDEVGKLTVGQCLPTDPAQATGGLLQVSGTRTRVM